MLKDQFVALGGGNEIGASCYLLCLDGVQVLVDAGMRLNAERAFPDFAVLNSLLGSLGELDCFLLTHAHLDHCGALTRFHYEAPQVPKYTTGPTVDLIQILLGDALRLNRGMRSEDWHVVETTRQLLDNALASFQLVGFEHPFSLGCSAGTATAIRAGHILGASSYLIEVGGKRVLITGDISLHAQRAVPGFDLEGLPSDLDALIIESTYAYQPDYYSDTLEEQQYALAETVSRIVKRGGRVLIPAFALGRAQEIAALFNDFFEQGLIDPFPVRVDGLTKPICEVYNDHREYLLGRLGTKSGHLLFGDHVQPMPDGFYPTARPIAALPPMCIISSSGMLLDGTRSAGYAAVLLENAADAVLFSGYLDDESPGSRLRGLQKTTGQVRLNGQSVTVRAEVGRYHLSAHAPGRDLRQMMRAARPRQIILVHGDYSYAPDATFVDFCLTLEREGVHVHQTANGIPIYL